MEWPNALWNCDPSGENSWVTSRESHTDGIYTV